MPHHARVRSMCFQSIAYSGFRYAMPLAIGVSGIAFTAMRTAAAYLTLLESFKYYLIKSQPINVGLSTRSRAAVNDAFGEMGCSDKSFRFCDVGFAFPYTMTTIIDSRLVLFSARQPASEVEYLELRAAAGHEAVHVKERHGTQLTFTALIIFEMVRGGLTAIHPKKTYVLPVFAAVLCAGAVASQFSCFLESRADRLSASVMGTEQVLVNMIQRSGSGVFHPAAKDRSAALSRDSRASRQAVF